MKCKIEAVTGGAFVGAAEAGRLAGLTEEEMLAGMMDGTFPPFVSTPMGRAWSRAEVEACRGSSTRSH